MGKREKTLILISGMEDRTSFTMHSVSIRIIKENYEKLYVS